MSLSVYGVPADIGALKEAVETLDALGSPAPASRRHNTKRNPGIKLVLGRADEVPEPLEDDEDASSRASSSTGDYGATRAEAPPPPMQLAVFKSRAEAILTAFLAEQDYDGALALVAARKGGARARCPCTLASPAPPTVSRLPVLPRSSLKASCTREWSDKRGALHNGDVESARLYHDGEWCALHLLSQGMG